MSAMPNSIKRCFTPAPRSTRKPAKPTRCAGQSGFAIGSTFKPFTSTPIKPKARSLTPAENQLKPNTLCDILLDNYRGGKGSLTTVCGQRFVWGGVHVQRPTFKPAGNHVSPAHTDAACVHFEGWRLTVNSTTSNTRPHTAVGSPFPPGGAGEGLGVRVGVAAQELLHR